MAAETYEGVCQGVQHFYALVANIPASYRSSDLRQFFSKFIELEGFECFHFRHRPEGQNPKENKTTENDLATSSVTDTVRSTVNSGFGFDINKYNRKPEQKTKIDKSKKTCCIVKLLENKYQELVQLYHKKHWLDKHAQSIPSLCFISKIKMVQSHSPTINDAEGTHPELTISPHSSIEDNTSDSNQCDILKTRNSDSRSPLDVLIEDDLNKIPELQPPQFMPNGNVGTPSAVFLQLIQQCRLPQNIIRSLRLTFPKSTVKGVYSNVTFDYGKDGKSRGTKVFVDLKSGKHSANASCSRAASEGPKLKSLIKRNLKIEASCHNKVTDDQPQQEDNEDANNSDKEHIQSESEEDADDCEEWERHEALHDDPANIERNKERKYEEELEVVWEKGGPGLVWYTDEQFWREKDGDFDEQTVDDWDVDMSVYYEPNAGDKDARDMVTMRRDSRRRKGYMEQDQPVSNDGSRIGHFERHTKGIGRKVLEKQGWMEGAGVGCSTKGLTQALDNDGQKPMDKTGFGYRGEKLQRYSSPPKRIRRNPDDVIISTIYDNPKDLEIPETLLRRTDHNTMSYREKIRNWQPTEQHDQ